MNVYTIPPTLEAYAEGAVPPIVADEVLFVPVEGEVVHVLHWERYPSYDLIFGVPDKNSPRYEKEIAFFCVRHAGEKAYGHYFDVKESEAMLTGFEKIVRASKLYSQHLWHSPK